MTQKRGLAIVGLGMAALPHAKSVLALRDRVDCVATWSPSAERRERFSDQFQLPVVASLEAILHDPSISAVLLLTPPNARSGLVTAIAASGKHILMEKPLERTTEAATEIVEQCAAAGVRLGVVFQHRFREASLALRRLIDSGRLGALETVQVNVPWWRDQAYYDEPGRGSYARDGGGVLISQAIHSLDLMLSLTGPVTSVAAIAGKSAAHQMESEDFVAAGLTFANGAMGSLMATTACYPGSPENMTLSGALGTAVLFGGHLRVNFRDGREETVGEAAGSGGGADPMAFPHEWHQRLIEDFLDALDARREPVSNGRSALKVHHLIDALLRSAAQSRQISVG